MAQVYKIFKVNFELICYAAKHHPLKYVINYLFDDFKKSLFNRIEQSTETKMAKRLFLFNGNLRYAVYLEQRNQR